MICLAAVACLRRMVAFLAGVQLFPSGRQISKYTFLAAVRGCVVLQAPSGQHLSQHLGRGLGRPSPELHLGRIQPSSVELLLCLQQGKDVLALSSSQAAVLPQLPRDISEASLAEHMARSRAPAPSLSSPWQGSSTPLPRTAGPLPVVLDTKPAQDCVVMY